MYCTNRSTGDGSRRTWCTSSVAMKTLTHSVKVAPNSNRETALRQRVLLKQVSPIVWNFFCGCPDSS